MRLLAPVTFSGGGPFTAVSFVFGPFRKGDGPLFLRSQLCPTDDGSNTDVQIAASLFDRRPEGSSAAIAAAVLAGNIMVPDTRLFVLSAAGTQNWPVLFELPVDWRLVSEKYLAVRVLAMTNCVGWVGVVPSWIAATQAAQSSSSG